jgi:AcrR family transcriptional regulator
MTPSSKRKTRRARRRHLPAAERKSHLLDIGIALVRDRGWQHLSIANVAKRAGVSRQLVHQYFGDLEQLGIGLATRFFDEVYDVAVTAMAHHLDDQDAVMREMAEKFLIGLREDRRAYVDFVTGHWQHRKLQPPLRHLYGRHRKSLIELWSKYFERVNGLPPHHANVVATLQFDSFRGFGGMVDAGELEAEEAIALLIQIVGAIIETLGGRPVRPGTGFDPGGET